jgi:hypothetical protein
MRERSLFNRDVWIMKKLSRITKVIFIVLLFLSDPPGFAADAPLTRNLQMAGWIENISIFPGNLKIKAKLDTGARNSSLNAKHLEEFYRDGDKWVRFKLKNWKGRTENFEAKIIRTATIKQHGNESLTRPVIRLGICLGNVFKEVEVNLEDRRKFNYQMLIGRSFLKNSFAVDSSATFTVEPDCQGAAPK